MRLRLWRRPDAPHGVRLLLRDDTVIGPLPLRYDGWCKQHRYHQWRALVDWHMYEQVKGIDFDRIPQRTVLCLHFMSSENLERELVDG